ncbi:MAG: galactose mutarotase [Streptococcaceae bacterium]|jgi:aldose 1-epimerase|nr:galactose mutarotase [Streptococcaceae bacterium]
MIQREILFKKEGDILEKIILSNEYLTIELLNYGARWHKTIMPDRFGNLENVMLSLDEDKVENILTDNAQFGATVGPIAGRIKNGYINEHIQLEKNLSEKHNLHSSPYGWDQCFFDIKIVDEQTVAFTLKYSNSPFADEISLSVQYQLIENQVIHTMEVISDENTYINPTNHSYFNLSGNAKQPIEYSHELLIDASFVLETDLEKIPTGNLIENTDFKELTAIPFCAQLDHCFVLEKIRQQTPDLILSEKISGRQLSIKTSRSCLVVFSATHMKLPIFVNGQKMSSQLGLAIEPQEEIEILRHPDWGSIYLPKGQTKRYQTNYTFQTST